jgi:hypothetical protein
MQPSRCLARDVRHTDSLLYQTISAQHTLTLSYAKYLAKKIFDATQDALQSKYHLNSESEHSGCQ